MTTFFENKFPALLLWPLSLLYGLIIVFRNFLYDLHILKSHKAGCPVICVGNITVGGTGKTPTIILLVSLLSQLNLKIAIISRGYGRESRGTVLVCNGKEILVDAARGGDEPLLIAQETSAIVAVDEDRVRGAKFLAATFSPDVILMDDGYQHRRLHRDINLLTVRSGFAFGNRMILPAGPLREPIFQGMKRADAVLINGDSSTTIPSLIPIFKAGYHPVSFKNSKGNVDLAGLAGKKAMAFCGLANPESFYTTLRSLEIDVLRTMSFADHHAYTQSDIDSLATLAGEADVVLTTEKDWVKLPEDVKRELNLYALHVELQLEDKKAFATFLWDYLKSVSMLYKKVLAF